MPPSLDEATVRHVAHLARLEISDEEVARFAEQLSSILGYIEKLNELDTTDVPPTAHALAISNVFREDAVRPSCEADRALHNAPQCQEGFFRVPKVLDQESA
ncbi:MAG: Asp-tRNA(Asn)/Glu-tRNA(Gln) amidotransferase subunit GatC [Phycisphaerae bacterium]